MADSPAAAGRPLRVLTANINAESHRYEDRLPLLHNAVAALDPDLMAFQEAGAYSREGPHQVARMLEGLGYHIHHQFDGLAEPPRRDGNCIASRWPVQLVETLSLQVTGRCAGYPLAAMAARIHIPPPVGELLFVNAKPSWELWAEHERELQAVAVVDLVECHADSDGFPPIVAGDFDATPDSASIRFLTGQQSLGGRSAHFLDAWAMAGDGSAGHTWSCDNLVARAIIERLRLGDRHRRRIDYVFLGSPLVYRRHASFVSCRVVMTEPEGDLWPTDHYGVFAEIALGR